MQHTKDELISGLVYIADYLDDAHADALWQAIHEAEWSSALRRKTQHYGYVYDYRKKSVDYSMHLGDLPAWGQAVATRLHDEGLMPAIPDQIIVNAYEVGEGIAPHIDCEPCFGDTIVSISLGSGCLMDFRQVETGEKLSVYLAPRSLLRMTGEARYRWTHGIAKRNSDTVDGVSIARGKRVSLTMRKVILQDVG